MSEVSNTIEFELVSPEKLLMSEPVEMVVVPGTEGDVGVLPGHSLLIAAVRPGVIDIHEGGQVRESIFVAGGFAEVTPERCTVLAEEAMAPGEIDRGQVESQIRDLGEDMRGAQTDTERRAVQARLLVAEAKLAALEETSGR